MFIAGNANGPTHHSTSFFPSPTIGAVVVDRGAGQARQLCVASFGGSINLFSPVVSDTFGGSREKAIRRCGRNVRRRRVQGRRGGS
jgi:iron complex outermembrane receptor protein